MNLVNQYDIEFVDNEMNDPNKWPVDTGMKSLNLPVKVRLTKK